MVAHKNVYFMRARAYKMVHIGICIHKPPTIGIDDEIFIFFYSSGVHMFNPIIALHINAIWK